MGDGTTNAVTCWEKPSMFTQILDPTGNLFVTWLVALVPVVLLLFLLAGLRMSAWLAVLIGSIVTFLLGLWVWKMPLQDGALAYLYGAATGVWNVNWITFWGVMLFNTLVTTGAFDKLRRWLVQQGTRDVRVQTILFAWAFGALLEGLVGFGYPWAFVAPILITLGIPALDQDRRDKGPGIAEADQSLEQRAKGPGEEDGLDPYIAGALLHQPAPQLVERTGRNQRIEEHHSPKRDPVDVPYPGRRTVKISERTVLERHLPDPEGKKESHDRTDQDSEPGRHTKASQQEQLKDDGNQRDQPGHKKVSGRIEDLREHGRLLPASHRVCRAIPHCARRHRVRMPSAATS